MTIEVCLARGGDPYEDVQLHISGVSSGRAPLSAHRRLNAVKIFRDCRDIRRIKGHSRFMFGDFRGQKLAVLIAVDGL
jgi:hypothetical protein